MPCGGARRTISVGQGRYYQSSYNLHFSVPKINWSAWLVSCRLKLKKATRESHRDLENIACQLRNQSTLRVHRFISTKTADHTGLVNWSLSHLTRALSPKPTFGIRLGTGTTAGAATAPALLLFAPGDSDHLVQFHASLLKVNSFPQKLMHGV